MPTPDFAGFVRELMAGWPEPAGEDGDGLFLQELGEKYGVLVPETRRTYCADGEACACADGYEEGETWICFRLHPEARTPPEAPAP